MGIFAAHLFTEETIDRFLNGIDPRAAVHFQSDTGSLKNPSYVDNLYV